MEENTDVIDEINHLNMLVEKGEFDKDTLAFYVASRIVEHKDLSFLSLIKVDVVGMVKDIALAYEEQGKFTFTSIFGDKDQTEMAGKLSGLLRQIN